MIHSVAYYGAETTGNLSAALACSQYKVLAGISRDAHGLNGGLARHAGPGVVGNSDRDAIMFPLFREVPMNLCSLTVIA